jgi:hypothetical protein
LTKQREIATFSIMMTPENLVFLTRFFGLRKHRNLHFNHKAPGQRERPTAEDRNSEDCDMLSFSESHEFHS